MSDEAKLPTAFREYPHEIAKDAVKHRHDAHLAAHNTGVTAKNSAITNAELRKLNETSDAILAANRQLVALQNQALNEATRQTALAEQQLQIHQVNELEKRRQNEVKQAAFSVQERIAEISKIDFPPLQYFYYSEQLQEVQLVGLTKDSPNEITDKIYVKNVLQSLADAHAASKAALDSNQLSSFERYWSSREREAYLISQRDELYARLSDLNAVTYTSSDESFMRYVFYPTWPSAASTFGQLCAKTGTLSFNQWSFRLLYWIFSLALWGIPCIVLAVVYLLKKQGNAKSLQQAQLQAQLQSQLRQIEMELDGIQRFQSEFKAEWRIPA